MTDAMRIALEKISGAREYDPKDHERAAQYKREEGVWTTDEYLADHALSIAPQALAAVPAVGGEEGARLSNWLADYSHDLMEDGDLDQEAVEVAKASKWIADRLAAQPVSPLRESQDVPYPVYKAVERILDENSAWIARPSDEVTKRIALAATVAAHSIIAASPPEQPAADQGEK